MSALMTDILPAVPGSDEEAGTRSEQSLIATSGGDNFWEGAASWFSTLYRTADKADESVSEAKEVKECAEQCRELCEQYKERIAAEETRYARLHKRRTELVLDYEATLKNKDYLERKGISPEEQLEWRSKIIDELRQWDAQTSESEKTLREIREKARKDCVSTMQIIRASKSWSGWRSSSAEARRVVTGGVGRYRTMQLQRYDHIGSRVRSTARIQNQLAQKIPQSGLVRAFSEADVASVMGRRPD